jgi:hypothetical protein
VQFIREPITGQLASIWCRKLIKFSQFGHWSGKKTVVQKIRSVRIDVPSNYKNTGDALADTFVKNIIVNQIKLALSFSQIHNSSHGFIYFVSLSRMVLTQITIYFDTVPVKAGTKPGRASIT